MGKEKCTGCEVRPIVTEKLTSSVEASGESHHVRKGELRNCYPGQNAMQKCGFHRRILREVGLAFVLVPLWKHPDVQKGKPAGDVLAQPPGFGAAFQFL